MTSMDHKERASYDIAKDYFDYLGRHLPQQCASDEFYFLPRAEAAIHHLNILDDLDPEKLRDHVHHVRALLGQVPFRKTDDLEADIDCLLLRQSMQSFIREFEEAKVWQKDPSLSQFCDSKSRLFLSKGVGEDMPQEAICEFSILNEIC